jgi:hypothetical protein
MESNFRNIPFPAGTDALFKEVSTTNVRAVVNAAGEEITAVIAPPRVSLNMILGVNDTVPLANKTMWVMVTPRNWYPPS